MSTVETALVDALHATLRGRVRVLGQTISTGHLAYMDALDALIGGPVLGFCNQHPFARDMLDAIADDVAANLSDAAFTAELARPLPQAGPLLHRVRLPGRTTTGLPAYYPAPTEGRLSALTRLDLVITGTIEGSARIGAARRELTRRREAAALDLADASPAAKAASTRAVHRQVAAEWGFGARIPLADRVLVAGSQGIGKTRLVVRELAKVRQRIAVRVLEPTLAKAAEVAADYAAAAKPDSLPSIVVRGRSAPDPDAAPPPPGKPAAAMCRRHEVAAEVAARGLSVRAALCAACPLAPGCGYLRQADRIKAMGGVGVYFQAHAALFVPSPAPVADMTVVDERVEGVELVEVPLPLVAPSALPYRGGPNLSAVTAAHATLDRVRDALARPAPLAILRAAGVTEEALRDAVRLLEPVAHPDPSIINGGMADAAILDRLAKVEGTGAGQVMTVLRAILREWDRARPDLVGVTLAKNTLTVSRLRRVQGVGHGGVLLLDGTGRAEGLQRKLFGGRLREEVIRLERRAHVTGTRGKGYSRQSVTGTDMYGRALDRRQDTSRALRNEVASIVERQPGPCLVVTAKGAAELMGDHLAGDAPQATYGALRGLNEWEECESAVIVGAPPLAMLTLEALARGVLADDDAPFVSADVPMPADWPYRDRGWPYWATRMRRMRDGSVSPVEVPIHPDPRVQAVFEEYREAELVQAADRVRPMFQQRNLVLANGLVLDVTYDVERTHAELVAGGNRWERAMAATGLVPHGARDLHRMHPRLFPTVKAAEHWIGRGGLSTPKPQRESSLEVGGTYFYRLKGQRGSLSRVTIDLGRHPDPRAALTAAFGPLTWFEDASPVPVPGPAPILTPIAPRPAMAVPRDAGWPPDLHGLPWRDAFMPPVARRANL